jgi:hypothetical protein
MPDTQIVINIHIPSDARLIIRALRRALGFFKALVENPRACNLGKGPSEKP